ncbi:Lsr2 dimerization domain-containing protein, partial [Modestobacter marinus]
MARKTTIVLEDDLTGQVLEDGHGGTVAFALDGQSYEIDLSADNTEQMRADLGRYV